MQGKKVIVFFRKRCYLQIMDFGDCIYLSVLGFYIHVLNMYRKFFSTMKMFYMIKTSGALHCPLLLSTSSAQSLPSHSACCRELGLVINNWGTLLPKKLQKWWSTGDKIWDFENKNHKKLFIISCLFKFCNGYFAYSVWVCEFFLSFLGWETNLRKASCQYRGWSSTKA